VGAEALVTLRYNGKTFAGKARLETAELLFRSSDLRLTIPFADMSSVTARGGKLTIRFQDRSASLDLGAAAEKRAKKIRHPPSRLEKLGAKPAWRVSAIGVADEVFLKELERIVERLSIGRVLKGSDAIFFGVSKEAELAGLEKLKASLQPDGALWIIRPKGRPEISERATMAAGKAAGLVDVKVVSFSTTHTAEKFVIPISARK
jgi:hypothetical protein